MEIQFARRVHSWNWVRGSAEKNTDKIQVGYDPLCKSRYYNSNFVPPLSVLDVANTTVSEKYSVKTKLVF